MILYQEYPPGTALAPYLACLWTSEVRLEGQSMSHRVLPDNCIDILWQDCARLGRVAGMMSALIDVPFHRSVRTIAVRFKPGAASYFFDLPLHELSDLHPSLPELWTPAVTDQFAEALWARPLSDREAIARVQRLLLRQLRVRPQRTALVEAALGAIERTHGGVRIETLADSLGVSRQHLASQFRSRVGLGAKQFARVCRFQHAAGRIRAAAPGSIDWAALALEVGFYDQPHMIHEFQSLAAGTPQSFAAMR